MTRSRLATARARRFISVIGALLALAGCATGAPSQPPTADLVALFESGNAHHRAGRHAEALSDLERGLRGAESRGARQVETAILLSIGNVHDAQGRHVEALAHFERGFRIAQEIRDERYIVYASKVLGNLHYKQQRHADALTHYRRLLAYLPQWSPGDQGELLYYVGLCEMFEKRYLEALGHLERGLAVVEQGPEDRRAELLHAVGLVYAKQERWRDALEYYDPALALAERLGLPQRETWSQQRDAARYLAR